MPAKTAKKAKARRAPVSATAKKARKAAKKTAAKRSTAKKAAPARKKSAAKRSTAKKAAPTRKKSAAKRSTVKKAAPARKKSTPKRSTAKKVPARKSTATRSTAKKNAPAKKSTARKAKPAAKAPRKITPKQALANTRKLLEAKQEQARQPQPWQTLDPQREHVPQTGFQSDEAAAKANELHAGESRMVSIHGSVSTHDRRNQGKRDHRQDTE
jgi:hypothetical protein